MTYYPYVNSILLFLPSHKSAIEGKSRDDSEIEIIDNNICVNFT